MIRMVCVSICGGHAVVAPTTANGLFAVAHLNFAKAEQFTLCQENKEKDCNLLLHTLQQLYSAT